MISSLKQFKSVHCVGIGGSGLSSLAGILKGRGYRVTGSDQTESAEVKRLIKQNVKIFIGHKASFLPPKTGLVIRSSAIPAGTAEIKEALKRGIPVMTYAQAVGLLTREQATICVCGTHGKTTTTALAAAALIACKKDPTAIVGSRVRELGQKNFRNGKGRYLVLESCEHFRSFMNYKPEIIIITNIEVDHLDYYKNLEDYVSAFRSFIKKLPKKGLLIANGDDANVKKIIKNFRGAKVILYGESAGNDYKLGGGAVKTPQNKKITLNLKIPGRHNLLNAAAVITLACELKLDPETANKALSSFQGSARRCELKGIIGRTHVIDDYAHHPTEIRATLRAMREKYGTRSRILCIFQPHQYSRTRLLLKDFAASFKDADEVIIPNILGVRDKPADIKKMTPEKLVKEISKNHPRASHINGFPETSAYVKKRLKNYDVVITMGAGDVWKIADEIIR